MLIEFIKQLMTSISSTDEAPHPSMNLRRGHGARSAKKQIFLAFPVNLRRGHGARSAKKFFGHERKKKFPAFPVNLRRWHEARSAKNFFGHERQKNFSLLSL